MSSYAIDDGKRLLLFDPLGVPSELEQRARERETAIVLTAPWHERDTQSLVERLGVPVYTPPADTAEDLMEKFGITREQAGDGSPDLAWLRASSSAQAHYFAAGDPLPFAIDVFPGFWPNDLVLWIEEYRTVKTGDTLGDFGAGLEINERWLPEGVTREQIAEPLRPLLELPVEHVLPAHGAPTNRSALERALG